ncbi:MAG: SusC/RagA family TonB-linked outer membrane protein [Marinifilaceae bacterium]
MKLMCVFLLFFTLNLSANVYSQNTKLDLSVENASIIKIFDEISNTSEYSFIYNLDDVEKIKNITINIKNSTVKNILDECFKNTKLAYTIDDRVIIIKELIQQQKERKISGDIVDSSGASLPGVSIVIKGSNMGVSSDINGHFILYIIDGKDKFIEISFIGMISQIVKITNKGNYKIILEDDSKELEDVVVTGFQTISKERATGSFNLVKSEQLDKPSQSLSSRLIGVVSGLQTTVDNNSNLKFEIRGKTSLNANAKPLIVVDGFPIEGDFESINPNNVESVTVLKDAGAASIWGARSANGVIVVTTKSAQKGSPLKVSINAFTKITDRIDLGYANPVASSRDQLKYEKMAYNNWGAIKPIGTYKYSKSYTRGLLALYNHEHGIITDQQRDQIFSDLSKIDYKDDVYKYLLQNPVYQQYNVSISGASERVQSFVSLMLDNNKSNYVGTDNKKYQLDSRFKFKINKWINLSVSTMLQLRKSNENGDNMRGIRNMSPYEKLVDNKGNYTSVVNKHFLPIYKDMPMNKFPYSDWSYNPLREMRNKDITRNNLNTRIQAGLEIKIFDGLSLNTNLQYELFSAKKRALYKEDSYYVRNMVNSKTEWDPSTQEVIRTHLPKGGILRESLNGTSSYSFRNQLNFYKVLAEGHQINCIAGVEVRERGLKQIYYAPSYGYNDKTLSTGNFRNGIGGSGVHAIRDWHGQNTYIGVSNSYSSYIDKFFSLYGNVAYTLKDKYSISASIRTDASNLITDDPSFRYSPFWSTGFSWRISKEDFLKDADFIDALTLRATYGYNGNIDKSTSFKPLISLENKPYIYTNQDMAFITSYGNPLLRWEKTGTLNIGVNYSLFGGKLYGSFDYYRKHGVDIMARVNLASINGTSSQMFNNAEILNSGIDIQLGSSIKILNNDIVWNGNLTYSYNYNEILELFVSNYSVNDIIHNAYVKGKNASTAWTYKYAGMQGDEPYVIGENGRKFAFSERIPNNVDGREFCKEVGVTTAPHNLGLTNSFKIYDFNLSFIITGKFGHVFKTSGFNYPVVWSHSKLKPNNHIADLFSGNKDIPQLPVNKDYQNYVNWSKYTSDLDYNWHSASHIRFREVSLSYNIPSSIISKLKMSRAKIYIQANNLGVYAFNNYSMDPEYPVGTIKPSTSLLFGVKLDF